MKKHFIIALAALGLLTTLNSCSKDQAAEPNKKPVSTSYNPLDPGGFGYIDLGDGEIFYYEDGRVVPICGPTAVTYLLTKSA